MCVSDKADVVAIEVFHNHIDACAQCASNPFNLCPTGRRLIESVVQQGVSNFPGFPKEDKPNANRR